MLLSTALWNTKLIAASVLLENRFFRLKCIRSSHPSLVKNFQFSFTRKIALQELRIFAYGSCPVFHKSYGPLLINPIQAVWLLDSVVSLSVKQNKFEFF